MKDKIYSIIKEAITEVNEDLEIKLAFDKKTKLLSGQNSLDSFSLVNLIMIIEAHLTNEFNKEITLVNDSAFSEKNSPFLTIETLCNYVIKILEEK